MYNLNKSGFVGGEYEHFYGYLEIISTGHLGLCSIEYKEAVANRADEIKAFCAKIINS